MQQCHSRSEGPPPRLRLPGRAPAFNTLCVSETVSGLSVTRLLGLLGSGLAAILLLAGCIQDPIQAQEQARINAERARSGSIESALGNPVSIGANPTREVEQRETIWDLFTPGVEPTRQLAVNRYLWAASLDTLAFLPLEGADPFSGVIVTDWGRVAGDPTPFRVTVYISEPALDARALRVSAFRLQGGRAVAVAEADNRALENAILTRARQLRIAADGG